MSDLDAIPDLPRDREGPVFREPWEAKAFAMAVSLHEAGRFTWKEWAQRLAREIASGEPDDGRGYYLRWLAALEKIVAEKGLIKPTELARRKDEWDQAARATPHGSPIELRNRPR
ncbi:MAG TPA: nitrile hydratase accessory protein [Planctomycetota bacterium]|jgi:nitrile hydratase accessory protein|nr:nitrile hydratase accessory protein [Planctomycetota bacterium]